MILQPEISVILSTYNRHRPQGDCPSLFERALTSILNQTFSDFELILIDDASTDGTSTLCQKYAAVDSRIKLIRHHQNTQLPAKCYNEGIQKSSGRLITFMFDDDLWLPNALLDLREFFIDNLKKNPHLGMIYGLAELYNAELNQLIDANFGSEWDLRLLFRHNYLANCSVMVRRDVIDVVGGYDEHPVLRRICDWDLWQRIGRRYSVLRMKKIVAQVYQSQKDSVGIMFEWSPRKAKLHCLFRWLYPLKSRLSPWPQQKKYWKSFFEIYFPLEFFQRQLVKLKHLCLMRLKRFQQYKEEKPFSQPIYVTRPLLPDLSDLQKMLEGIWDSKILTNNGPRHQELEEAINKALKVPSSSLFNNGTIALITACQALKLRGEVITTPFTFPATPHVLNWNNISPVFCDIDPETMTIDHRKIESLITSKTSAILGVHVYGIPCAVNEIQKIADRYGLKVIYDSAHAFGTEIDGRGIGTFGDISMFSFHATKLFNTVEGGCVTFNDPNLKPRIDLLKNFGIKNENEVILPGINGKMNEIQASIGLLNLQNIEKEKQKRAIIARIYHEELNSLSGIKLVHLQANETESFQYFVIRIDESQFGLSRDQVHNMLKKWNIITRRYFYPLCSDYECYREFPSSSASNLPVAHRISREVLVLPFYGKLPLADVKKICTILKSLHR